LFQARRFAAAATASLLVAGAFFASPWSVGEAQAKGSCDELDVAVLPSPLAPWKGAPLRVIVATE